MPERLVYHWIVAPIPQHPYLTGAYLRYRVRLIGPNQFPCVQITSRKPTLSNLPPQYPTYCFESHHPMLRIVNTRISETVTSITVGELRGQYLPQRLIATLGGLPILRATLQQGQSYTRIDASYFTPPANAKPAPPPSTAILYLTALEAATHLIPSSIRHNQGWTLLHQSQAYVMLAASIGTTGHIKSIRILTPTDPELISSIYQSVSNFRYRPFLLNGAPAAVRTQIILDFRVPLPH